MLKDTITIILVTFAVLGLLTYCGDNDSHHHNNVINTITPEPEPTPEPQPEPEPIPEPIPDCCPKSPDALLCESCPDSQPCLTEHPQLQVYCFNKNWYLKVISSFTQHLYLKIPDYDMSCCDKRIGIEPSLCPLNACIFYYSSATQYSVRFINRGWYISDSVTYGIYRILR